MSFTVFTYNATVLSTLIQPNTKETQPMDGPNPCPSLLHVPHVKTDYLLKYY